jgi:hypothetical protein
VTSLFFLFKIHAFLLSRPLCIAILSIHHVIFQNINIFIIICLAEGAMGQDSGNEILPGKGVFRLKQAYQGLHFVDARSILVFLS